MRPTIRFLLGLVLALVFAGALMFVILTSGAIVHAASESEGDFSSFDALIDHYTNQSSGILGRARPSAVIAIWLLLAVIIALGSGVALKRMFPPHLKTSQK